MLDIFEALRIGAFVEIGGDDTMRTGNLLYERSLTRLQSSPDLLFRGAIVHVPKTIDNDLIICYHYVSKIVDKDSCFILTQKRWGNLSSMILPSERALR